MKELNTFKEKHLLQKNLNIHVRFVLPQKSLEKEVLFDQIFPTVN